MLSCVKFLGGTAAVFAAMLGFAASASAEQTAEAVTLPPAKTVQSFLEADWFRVDGAVTPELKAAEEGACEAALIPENKVEYHWPKSLGTDVPGILSAKGDLSVFSAKFDAPVTLMALSAGETEFGFYAEVMDLGYMRIGASKFGQGYVLVSFANEWTYKRSDNGWKESRNREVLKTVPYELAKSNALLEEGHILLLQGQVGETSVGYLYYPVGRDGAILTGKTHQYMRCNGLEGVVPPK